MATLFHKNTQAAAVHHQGGGALIVGGILAALLFVVFAIFVASYGGTWLPMMIGMSFGVSAALFGTVYHFTH